MKSEKGRDGGEEAANRCLHELSYRERGACAVDRVSASRGGGRV